MKRFIRFLGFSLCCLLLINMVGYSSVAKAADFVAMAKMGRIKSCSQ